jgi:NADH-quinone oxidoreductase subunit J
MTSLDLAFAACGLLAVVAGLLAVTTRQVVHAALWLVVALLGVAGCLLVLGHELVALVLVLVYVGAIVVLVLFALMLTRAPIGPDLVHAVPVWRRVAAGLAGAATTALLLAALLPLAGGAVERRDVATSAVATELFGTWVWPFEALSVLLLAALIAALAVSRGHGSDDRLRARTGHVPRPEGPDDVSHSGTKSSGGAP